MRPTPTLRLWRRRTDVASTDFSSSPLRLPVFVEKREHLVDIQSASARMRPPWYFDVLVLHAELLHLRDPLPSDLGINRGVGVALDDHHRKMFGTGNRVGRDVNRRRHRRQRGPD